MGQPTLTTGARPASAPRAAAQPRRGPELGYRRAPMRILIVHHGSLPSTTGPTTGGALRAWHHGQALQAAGHTVHWLARDQDGPGGFSSPADLALQASRLAPDRVVCVQPEDAPALATVGAPLAVDLYAPRLLEAPFEGALAAAATQSLRALAAGDVFLVSNPRQRLVWMGVMALAGLDTRRDPTLHIPLVAPDGPPRRRPNHPVLVAGGKGWPWQDPIDGLQAALDVLDARGEGVVQWFGAPPGDPPLRHPRLETPGWLPYGDLLAAYSHATLALDWMTPNPERAAALAFRQLDYLGCGLPILTGEDSALADVLGDAGWTVGRAGVTDALNAALDDPADVGRRSRAARRLARDRFALEAATAPLLAWIASPTRHPRAQGPLVEAAHHAAAAGRHEARAEAAHAACAAAEVEVTRKRGEVARLTAQVQDLVSTVARQARALDEVAAFKREAISVLGGQSEQARLGRREAESQLALLRADVEKKTAELQAMDELRARLENDNQNLRGEVHKLRNRGILRR